MAPYGMLPAHPPFPTCVYFPFQPDTGSHTANLMSESGVGLMTPFTSHRAGAVGAVELWPPRGAEMGPSGTTTDEVTVVYGSFRSFNFSHACCARAGDASKASTITAVGVNRRLNIWARL